MDTVIVDWNGRPVAAARPPAIADWPFDLASSTVRAAERARSEVLVTAGRAVGPLEVAARLLLRAEGVASSAIEGLRLPNAEVALARVDPGGASETAAWVADNLQVVDDALDARGPLTERRLLAWHRRLMAHGGLPAADVGAWRDQLVWVGGANPLVAAHVGPPAELVASTMADLVAFVARDDLDPVTHAAIAHAQFETIHPFVDGNGRLGRILVTWLLAHRVPTPVPPPVSLVFARDVGGYLSGLRLYQEGHVDAWVRWFAEAVTAASVRSRAAFDAVADLTVEWVDATAGLRADSVARRLLPHLVDQPVLSVALVADLLDVSAPAARNGLAALEHLGVVDDLGSIASGPGRPTRWWAATAVLDLLSP